MLVKDLLEKLAAMPPDAIVLSREFDADEEGILDVHFEPQQELYVRPSGDPKQPLIRLIHPVVYFSSDAQQTTRDLERLGRLGKVL